MGEGVNGLHISFECSSYEPVKEVQFPMKSQTNNTNYINSCIKTSNFGERLVAAMVEVFH